MSDTMWITIVEWDGNNAPSVWYRRLHSLALRTRGDKERSALARRDSGRGGIIMQEGAIICASESLARHIAHMAEEAFTEIKDLKGQPSVSIGRIAISENFNMTPQDAAILDRIEGVLGRRGRKTPAEQWTITCTECVAVTEEATHAPVNCPVCSGFLIQARRGFITPYADPGGDVFQAWLRLRFTGGHFEPVPPKNDGRPTPNTVTLTAESQATADLIASSPVLRKIEAMPRDIAFHFLDGLYINRLHRSTEQRLANRVQAATTFFLRGGSPADVSLTEPAFPDLIDAVPTAGVDSVVAWMLVK